MTQLSLKREGNLVFKASSSDVGRILMKIFSQVCVELKIPVPEADTRTFISICKMVMEKYKHFSFEEIREAFKLNLYGDLNPHFYKDKSGKPENEPYGEMSAKFFSNVMQAYSRYQQHVRTQPGTVLALLPEKIYTEQQKKEIHIDYVSEICDWFENGFPTKPFPYITSEFNYKLFLELGLVPEWGLTDLVHKAPVKKNMSKKQEIKPIGAALSSGSMFYQYGFLIFEACKKLKDEQKSLRSIMSEKYGAEI